MSNWKRPSPAFVLALFATFVSLSGVGIAATGSNFILGKPNTADATSSLSGTIASGPMLQLNNTEAGGGLVSRSVIGRGITGQHTSATGTNPGVDASTASTNSGGLALTAANSGGGSAASFTVNNNTIPPFKVNSHGKVAGLNADSIDGMDKVVEAGNSGIGAIPGKLTSGRQQVLLGTSGTFPIISVGNIAAVQASTTATNCVVTFVNPASNPIAYTYSGVVVAGAGETQIFKGAVSSGDTAVATDDFALQFHLFAWTTGNPTVAARVIVLDATATTTGSTCNFAATMYVGGARESARKPVVDSLRGASRVRR